ncbi:MAG: ATP-binding cassette domain-containing protein [Candidatus Korarchaeota archaeon]|nr:ATP-binding cassette domain-containing protein [Candidatus Korarchaeota archaeon]NIU84926.1 ATP-binding cassette domain-containing protein [Candidatus Thorarchaeota archaeon]NIW14943.1 ATP-binding cassette domain-containing protein [Candidatus Thorarchaeota archaeon]NIW52910.1 ATP-binding cassette domain-containing protein [Candidatus Korarchaeota archaeon]
MNTAVEIKNLRVRYRGQKNPALNRIDLSVEKGEFVGIIGPTGAGKSTLCLTINGLIPQFVNTEEFSGDISILGRDTKECSVSELSQYIGMVFQDYESQIFRTNVELEISFGLENLALPRDMIQERINKSLNWTGIAPLRKRYTHSLSGGEKQRLAIASALAMQPDILVLDEATSDLDPKGKFEIYRIVKKLREKRDITLLMVDHHLTRIAEIADRIVVLDHGEIIEQGSPRKVFSKVDELLEMGLRPPPITELFHKLKLTPEKYPMSVEEAIKTFPQDYQFESLQKKAPPHEKNEPIIEIRDLWHTYDGDSWALSNINLKVGENAFIGLIGQNGSGKTTLAQCLNGIVKPTKGSIKIEGEEATTKSVGELGRTIGYVFQNPDYMITQEKVKDELELAPRNIGCSEEEVERRVQHAVETLNIEDLLEEDPFFLNRANRQRVAVGSIITLNPDIIVLDEPTTGLTPGETKQIMQLASEMHNHGKTIIVISHDLWIIAEYCDRVVALKDGEILMDGPPTNVFSQKEILRTTNLQPPQIAQFTQKLFGKTILDVKTLVENLKKG